jgi:hypothetical protein
MKKITTLMLILCAFLMSGLAFSQETSHDKPAEERKHQGRSIGEFDPFDVIDNRIDNMKYWRAVSSAGLTPIEPYRDVPPGIFKGSRINAKSVVREDSPDIPVTDENSTQSENSIFINPNDPDHVLQSNNSTTNPVGTLFGANYFFSYDFGQTWGGSIQGAGGPNSGDPTTAINLQGRQFVGYIHSNYGQGVSYSDNGVNWTPVLVASPAGGGILDKNHMWIDNSLTSTYEGNLYNAWTDFYGPNDSDIEFSRSVNAGISWTPKINVSAAVNAGSHNQGVNIQTGPAGEVYVVWSIYDSWPSDETAFGFARSFDGGVTFEPAQRILSNKRGIRTSGVSKNHRVNSFPSMAVDISGGDMNGNIYITWANIGVPGVNQGPDTDIYMIRSTDQGATWSAPFRVNQNPSGMGHKSYFPWVTCDPETGVLSVIYYDDRNVGGSKCEVFCANSFDGGETWEDFRVSDTDFTPSPIPGLANGYMGDYLGIAARGSKVYPVWTDNRNGIAMTYVSPYETNSLPRPTDLQAMVIFETGEAQLSWQFENVPGFQYFVVYRDNFQIGTTTSLSYSDFLPEYGIYKFTVTAMHNDGESAGPSKSVQWGDAHIAVNPDEIIEYLEPGATSTRFITIENTGQLNLIYTVSSSSEPVRDALNYCIPSANCSWGDGLTGFAMGDIDNMSNGCSANGYGDFTDMSTEVQIGETYDVTLRTGYSDQYVTIWIDFNKNEVFDPSELVLDGFHLPQANQNYTAQVTIPDGVESGETRMRVKAEWQNVPTDPCADMSYGETEDYTVSVSGWLFVQRVTDTIAPGNTQLIEVNFDSDGLDEGDYLGNVKIASNDPDAPEVNVPVTLHVTTGGAPLSVDVIATPGAICEGESTQLEAIVTGGSGTYTYDWTSDPAGFSSNMPNPVVTPDFTTTYFVEVDDGNAIVNGQVKVVVVHTPEQAATPQGDQTICKGAFQTVYNTGGAEGAESYQWLIEPMEAGAIEGNGLNATVTWNEEFTGLVLLTVYGVNNCGEGEASEALEITVTPLPAVYLGEDIEVCANESVLLDAGNPGATYMWSTGATTQTILADTTGFGLGVAEFWVQVTDINGCAETDSIAITFKDCTGIHNMSDNWQVTVYPNPNKGEFSIEMKTIRTQKVDLVVLNSIGNEVYRNVEVAVNGITRENINLQHLNSGIFYLRIYGDGLNYVQKIVIQ